MQIWFARGSEVSIREQLVTQVVLGILSNDLAPGQRLPSTRELARRFRLHPNTVSAGYRKLEREGWVKFRHGSGVYVRETKPQSPLSSALAFDQIVASLFRSARELGIPLASVRSRLSQWLELQPPDHFLLIEPDEELSRIVAMEMAQAATLPVTSCSIEQLKRNETLEGAIPAALPRWAGRVRLALPSGSDLLTLSFRSVTSSLAHWLPAPSGALVGITSRWPQFLTLARTMLIAAGFHADALVFRDAREPNWRRGLKQTAAVICDSLTAKDISKGTRVIVFPLLSESSITGLRRYREFVRNPIAPLQM